MLTIWIFVFVITVKGSEMDSNCSCHFDCTEDIYVLTNHNYKFDFSNLIINAGESILGTQKLKVEFCADSQPLFTKQLDCGGNCSTANEISTEVSLSQDYYEAKLISDTDCVVKKFKVNFLGEEVYTCAESVRLYPRVPMEMYARQTDQQIECVSEPKSLDNYLQTKEKSRVRWYKDCEMIVETTWEQGYLFNISQVNLSDTPGIYSCDVTVEDKTFFIMHRPVCVRPHFTDFTVTSTITGTNVTALPNQKEVTLHCSGELAASPMDIFYISWVKLPESEELCGTMGSNPEDGCFIEVEENPCYLKPTNEEKSIKVTSTFHATYILRDVGTGRISQYQCRLMTARIAGPISASVFVIVQDNARLRIIIGCLAALIMFSIVCTLTIHVFWIEVQYFWKKYFRNEIPADFDKPYVVYLSYNYDENLTKQMKGNVQEAITTLHDQLHKLECNYYDPAMPSEFEYEIVQVGEEIVPAAKKVLGKCRSFMMVLTDNAVQDDEWTKELTNILALTKNAIEDIEIVFLCTPSAKKLLKKKASDGDKTSIVFEQFMSSRKNFVIKWKIEKMKSARFYKALYVALPKVEKNSVVFNSYIV